MKFDYVTGNPPFNTESVGANENDTPLYHYFYDAAFQISDKVELITPGRFLFNAGGTPKEWNEKMLNDVHFSVLYYEGDASKVFAGKSINGGIAIGYRDTTKVFEPIGIFTAFPELNNILLKINHKSSGDINTLDCLRELPAYAIGTEVTAKTAQFVKDSCLTANELIAYGNKSGTLYCWNVSDVQSMDMSLRELGVKRAPQSWMYLRIPDNKTF